MGNDECAVRGCFEQKMSRLPFCPDHIYEHRQCEVFGCLEFLRLNQSRCRMHHPHELTKKEVAAGNVYGLGYAAE